MVKSSNLSWIVVSDFDKAVKFFSEKIGLKVQSTAPEYGWAELRGQEGGALLGLAQAGPQNPTPAGSNGIITFSVENIEKTRADFEKKGVLLIGEIMEVPGHVKLQLFKDDDGNLFQIVESLD